MTNEQCNALTKAIITGFTILAKAHMNAVNASHSRQGAFLNTIDEDPNCCALPIEPPAPVEAEASMPDKWRDLEIGEKIRPGDQCKRRDAGPESWVDVHPEGTWVGRPAVESQFQFRRKIDAKDGDA
jgi:hypothetical protein